MYSRIVILIMLLLSVYYVGVLRCNQKNLSQKLKETIYVNAKELKILSYPNADKSDLLSLMFHNKL